MRLISNEELMFVSGGEGEGDGITTVTVTAARQSTLSDTSFFDSMIQQINKAFSNVFSPGQTQATTTPPKPAAETTAPATVTSNSCVTVQTGPVSNQTCTNSDGTVSSQTCVNLGLTGILAGISINKCTTIQQ